MLWHIINKLAKGVDAVWKMLSLKKRWSVKSSIYPPLNIEVTEHRILTRVCPNYHYKNESSLEMALDNFFLLKLLIQFLKLAILCVIWTSF